MRKTIRTMWLGAALFAVPLASHAAGFDCAKAASPVEKAICASPKLSAADGKLSQSFAAALKGHPDKADALRLDQRHWLAFRDDYAWGFLSGGLQKEVESVLSTQYEERIAFLDGLDAGKPGRPLTVVWAALPKLPVGTGNPLEALAKQGAPITLAKDAPLDNASVFPFEADEALRKDIAGTDGPGLTNRVLSGAPISSVYSIGGTAACYAETPYRIDGKKASAIAIPPVWGDGDCGTSHDIARLGDDTAAVYSASALPDEHIIAASRWNGKAFDKAVAVMLRFDHSLSPGDSACAPTQSPCDDFVTTVMPLVARYDQHPLPGTINRLPKSADKAAFEAAAQLAKAKGAFADADDPGDQAQLPVFGTKAAVGRMTGYDSEATTFPIVFRGETLLGLIGHGHVGWRASTDWIVSAWRAKNGKLEPVASVYVEVKRGPLLLSSVVPPPVPESH